MTPTRTLSLALAALVLLTGPAGAQLRRPRAELAPLAASDGVQAGATAALALHVALPAGLHVQSDAPRDPSLIPTALTLDPPPGVTVEEILYPPAEDLVQEGLPEPLAVFDREFTIGVRVAVAAQVPAGELVVPARLRYQACDNQMCYAPAIGEVSWTLRIVPSGTPVAAQHADVFAALRFGGGGAGPVAPPLSSVSPAAAPPAAPATTTTTTTTTGARDDLAALGGFEVVATTGGYLDQTAFLQFVRDAEQGVAPKGLFEGRGPLAILLLVFLGGLALNLTPCVLPMIPINLAIIGAGVQAGSRRRGLVLGSAYGTAMALVYGVLGVVVILTAGTFGTLNASPWFNLGIAALFVALALAMFDVFQIDFSRFAPASAGGHQGRGRLAVAFTMGGVAALLAGACVAPVVIQVVVFATGLYAAGHTIALALPFVLGLGMALPWPIAGAGIAALPRPGAWMVRVKQVFGVLILVAAVYYGHLAWSLFANRFVDPAAVASSVEEKLKAGWHSSLASGLAEAEREDRPVLVDLWATWCKNCLTMDTTTFADPAVIDGLKPYVKVKFQAEDPDDPVTRAVMSRVGAVGLPTYAILRRAGTTPATP